MGKLKSLPSRLDTFGNRVGVAAHASVGQPVMRERDNAPWRTWYKTARWRALRQKVLVRDAYTCQRTGVICGGTYPADDSPVVNHKQPHRGDVALFWDESNLETVSKAVHDSVIQREEQASLHHRGVWD
ncbi:HNH endonuclease [Brevundimonas sp.]|uniref:HNH endonuclease n=1 Tax=Brevundimonas sp. TaxID=1871086 RepID=UPI002899D60C|nr:HNH endonuclease [Brevundimonas sp.]